MRKRVLRYSKKRRYQLFLPFYFLALSLTLSLILDPVLGKYLWLEHRQKMIKRQVEEQVLYGLGKERLVLLEFTTQEVNTKLKWRSAREFEFNHELYDVVESILDNEKILFWCWRDHPETRIEKEIEALLSSFQKKGGKSLILEEGSNSSNSMPKIYLFFPSSGLSVNRPDLFSFFNLMTFKAPSSLNNQPPSPPPRWLT